MKNTTRTLRPTTLHSAAPRPSAPRASTALTTTAAAPSCKAVFSDDAFFAEETDTATEARRQALEVITRVLIWIAEGTNAPSREVRATVALYCVRPDLIGCPTLEQIGHAAGISGQAAHKLAQNFRASMGFDKTNTKTKATS